MIKFNIVIALCVMQISGISFYVKEGQEKCFSDEIPSRTVIIVYHELLSAELPEAAKENQQKGQLLTQGLEFRVYDPTDALFQKLDVKVGPNKFSFTSLDMGRYKFCVFKSKSFWKTDEFKYSMKIQQGVDFTLEGAANKTHVMDLQCKQFILPLFEERIDGLKSRTKDFISLQQLNREQEDKLTTQSILINQRVVQTTVIQILVLLASGIYQIFSLRKFFKERFLM